MERPVLLPDLEFELADPLFLCGGETIRVVQFVQLACAVDDTRPHDPCTVCGSAISAKLVHEQSRKSPGSRGGDHTAVVGRTTSTTTVRRAESPRKDLIQGSRPAV